MVHDRERVQILRNRSVGIVGSQAVCLRPSAADLAKRTSIVLTERDVELLLAVYQHRFLPTSHIERAFFPAPNGPRSGPCSRAYERLRLLWLWDYLVRVEVPVSRHLGGRCPFQHGLGRRGIPRVQARLGPDAPPVEPVRLDRFEHRCSDHDLATASLWVGVVETVRDSALTGPVWCSERELRRRDLRVDDPRTGARLSFLPDAYFELGYPDGTVQSCVAEMDMGSVKLAAFGRKVRAFEAYLAAGRFAEQFGRGDFDVWVVTSTEDRLAHLQQVARREVAPGRWDAYLFTTLEALAPGEIANARWLSLDGATSCPFYEGAFDQGPAAPRRSG